MGLDEKIIDRWVQQGVITETQSKRMRADVVEARKEYGSNRLITALSTIGALLLGIGAILFIASNWQEMSRLMKQVILLASTFGSLGLGYYFHSVRRTLPKLGSALIFLSSLLFGATLALLGQMYHTPANASGLLLVWLIGVAPLAYFLRSGPLATVAGVLLVLWAESYTFYIRDFFSVTTDTFVFLPLFTLVLGAALFTFGGVHSLKTEFFRMARVYRIIGAQVALAVLFLFSFAEVLRELSREAVDPSPRLLISLVVATAATLLFGGWRILSLKNKTHFDSIEYGVTVAVVGLAYVSLMADLDTADSLAIIFTIGLALVALVLLWMGYEQEDLRLVNMGSGWLGLLILVRYFDFFWDLLPRSLFFLIGGALLVGGGTWLERKRRQLKKQFTETV